MCLDLQAMLIMLASLVFGVLFLIICVFLISALSHLYVHDDLSFKEFTLRSLNPVPKV